MVLFSFNKKLLGVFLLVYLLPHPPFIPAHTSLAFALTVPFTLTGPLPDSLTGDASSPSPFTQLTDQPLLVCSTQTQDSQHLPQVKESWVAAPEPVS